MDIGFWIYMLVCAMITPLIMVITGMVFIKRPPKENSMYGYYTKRSTQSPEAWKFANEYLGRLWLVAGLIMLPLSAAVMVLLLIMAEISLKQKFDK